MHDIVRLFRDRLAATDHSIIPAPADPRVANPAPRNRAKDLGPNQLQWCKDKIPNFASHKRQADEAEAHRIEMLRKAGVKGSEGA